MALLKLQWGGCKWRVFSPFSCSRESSWAVVGSSGQRAVQVGREQILPQPRGIYLGTWQRPSLVEGPGWWLLWSNHGKTTSLLSPLYCHQCFSLYRASTNFTTIWWVQTVRLNSTGVLFYAVMDLTISHSVGPESWEVSSWSCTMHFTLTQAQITFLFTPIKPYWPSRELSIIWVSNWRVRIINTMPFHCQLPQMPTQLLFNFSRHCVPKDCNWALKISVLRI